MPHEAKVSHLLGKYLNTMVADLGIEGKGQYLRDLFSQYEAELSEAHAPATPATGNYVCDDEVFPQEATFDNGRVVKIAWRDDGRPFLMISPKSEYPKPCGICDGVIQSKDDLDWHGYGNCRDIPEPIINKPVAEAAPATPATPKLIGVTVPGAVEDRLQQIGAVAEAAPTTPEVWQRGVLGGMTRMK